MARRGIDDLSPLPLDEVPDELRSMVQHTNDLLRRLAEAVHSERRFISDAAHQLRTPVAGIRLLVEDLRRVHQADPQQPPDGEVLFELHSAADRATRLVRQLLSLAHSEGAGGAEPEPVALAPLMRRVVERHGQAAQAAGKSIHFGDGLQDTACEGAQALALPLLLEEALANVLDNAIRYGGPACGWTCCPSPPCPAAAGACRWMTTAPRCRRSSARTCWPRSGGAMQPLRKARAWACPSRARPCARWAATFPCPRRRRKAARACGCCCAPPESAGDVFEARCGH